MRSFYAIPEARALAYLDRDQFGRWTLTGISVPVKHQGQGFGSRLLRLVLEDADLLGETIHVKVASSGPLDDAALIAWYGRYGFEPDPRSVFCAHGALRRLPPLPATVPT